MVLAERPQERLHIANSQDSEDILARYLPGILRQDPFLANFLRVFDSMLRPMLEMLDAIDYYFDPDLMPSDLLSWLGNWVGEELPRSWPESARRALIREAASIHRTRGTQAGLKRALEVVTGREVLVIDSSTGLRLDGEAKLGINSSLEVPEPNTIHVVIHGGSGVDLSAVTDVIKRLKPAHAAFSIRLVDE
jgi:phage tail-like protein